MKHPHSAKHVMYNTCEVIQWGMEQLLSAQLRPVVLAKVEKIMPEKKKGKIKERQK